MATSTSDKFIKSVKLYEDTLDAAIADGSTSSLTVAAGSSDLVNGEVYFLSLFAISSTSGSAVTTTLYETVAGIYNSATKQFTSLNRGVEGSATSHPVGRKVAVFLSAAQWNRMIDGITVEHGQDGTHDATKVAMLAGSQTFTGQKTLTTPIIDDSLLLNHESSVTTPSPGKLAIYAKSDDKLYKKDSSGTETEVGASGSGILTTSSYAPEGFLINGKISVTVASNNITVAIKGLDGNDPSGSNIVYVRIGDTVRQLTTSLSVTKNAGTNWMNMGSSTLATKEVDLFTYLIWNTGPATDILDIGFSRRPDFTNYSQFSTTSTNENYLAYGNATQPNSADACVNIGRFAATLSAAASYNWSVPSFNAQNLIQRPIYETRKLSWTPTYPVGYSTPPTSPSASYVISGSTAYIYYFGNGGGSTSNSTSLQITLPIASQASSYRVYPLVRSIDNNAASTGASCAYTSAGSATLNCEKTMNTTTSWTASGQKDVCFSIAVEI